MDRRIVPWVMPGWPASSAIAEVVVLAGAPGAAVAHVGQVVAERPERLDKGLAPAPAAFKSKLNTEPTARQQFFGQRMAAVALQQRWPTRLTRWLARKATTFQCCPCARHAQAQVSMPLQDQPRGVWAHAGAKVAQAPRYAANAPTVLSR
jgi:hypothetical protein